MSRSKTAEKNKKTTQMKCKKYWVVRGGGLLEQIECQTGQPRGRGGGNGAFFVFLHLTFGTTSPFYCQKYKYACVGIKTNRMVNELRITLFQGREP